MKREDIAAMGALQRKELLEDVADLVHREEWRIGEAVRFLRAVVLRRSRQNFARLVGISPAALQQLEDREDVNPTLHTLNAVMRPFGAAMGFVFPRMHPSPEPTAEVEQRRAMIKDSLASTRRLRKA
ncbi:MAG: hypothetical protein Q8K32_25720 [Archangium sp.]|nr:hypothetical protein [Archangium sp.]